MKDYLFVLKIDTSETICQIHHRDYVTVFSFFTFGASPRFFKIKDYKTRKSIVLYGVYLYDNALVQYILNFC